MKKHTRSVTYYCPVLSCNSTFYRGDKFRNHLVKMHGDDDQATCSFPNCATGPMPLDLLRLHTQNHRKVPKDSVCSVLNGFLVSQRRCPLPSCNSTMDISKVHQHLTQHGSACVKENKDAIVAAGYDDQTLEPICPFCNGCNWIHASKNLFDHIQRWHLVTDRMHYQVFEQWEILKFLEELVTAPRLWRFYFFDRYTLNCQACNESSTDHHRSMLKDIDDIRPFRRAVLRVWPEFSAHPVFDDIMPTVDRHPDRLI